MTSPASLLPMATTWGRRDELVKALEQLERREREYESFSDVVMRVEWPDVGLTGGDLLRLYEKRGPCFTEEALDRVEEAKAEDRPPEDKWTRP